VPCRKSLDSSQATMTEVFLMLQEIVNQSSVNQIRLSPFKSSLAVVTVRLRIQKHPKLAAPIMFMSEWEPMCRDCYWWRDKNCD
jgi:hypothetical protein